MIASCNLADIFVWSARVPILILAEFRSGVRVPLQPRRMRRPTPQRRQPKSRPRRRRPPRRRRLAALHPP